MLSRPQSGPVKPSINASERTLRAITVLAFVPAVALLIPHGILTKDFCPAIGLVPAFLSFCFSIVRITNKAKSRRANISIDAFIAAFLVGTLIPGWVLIARDWDTSKALVGAYGTMPLMMDLYVILAKTRCVWISC